MCGCAVYFDYQFRWCNTVILDDLTTFIRSNPNPRELKRTIDRDSMAPKNEAWHLSELLIYLEDEYAVVFKPKQSYYDHLWAILLLMIHSVPLTIH
jgi:hypothetical protein